MKILIINPNSDLHTQEMIEEKVRGMKLVGCQVDCVSLTAPPKLIASYEHQVMGAPEMIQLVKEHAEYDAFVIGCHGDPNLDVLRELSSRPVVGMAEASIKQASYYGNRFGILVPGKSSVSRKYAQVRKYYCDALFAGSRVVKENTKEALLYAARESVEQDHAEMLVLGCANYTLFDTYLEKELGIPVLDGISCGLYTVLGMAAYQKLKEEGDFA